MKIRRVGMPARRFVNLYFYTMPKLIAVIKFFACVIVIGAVIAGILTPSDSSLDSLVWITVIIIFIAFGALYSYYLIKTGTWNMREQPYSLNIAALIGLLIHFISSGLFVYGSWRFVVWK